MGLNAPEFKNNLSLYQGVYDDPLDDSRYGDVRDTDWFILQMAQLVRFKEFILALFTWSTVEEDHPFAFMKAMLGIDDIETFRQWNEKHIFGLPGFRCGINPDGLENVVIRAAKAAWAKMRPISMPR